MKNARFTIVAALVLIALAVPLANARPSDNNDNSNRSAGAVYIMTNDPAGNQILRYDRARDGSLSFSGKFSTGGLGATGLAGSNQGGLILANKGKTLLVVNAGSNDISVFKLEGNILSLTDKTSSHGTMPISLTIHEDLVYVLNAGGSDVIGNIAAFKLDDGELSPKAGSVQPLSGVTAPAEISFNPEGTVLVVTEKTTNKIDTYTVDEDGVASAPIIHDSSGSTPFGFAFSDRGTLVVSNAAGASLSSYSVSDSGGLTTISASVSTGNQQAPCWVVITGDSKYAYTTDAHSGTISSYKIEKNGSIQLLQSIAVNTGAGDIDMALTKNSAYLYVSIISSQSIQGYRVHHDGSLSWVTTITGIPAGADGLAAN